MNGISEYGDIIRAPEYQVVLIIDYDDGRMFPLTEDCPKCLLPVGNRKLLSYQLDMLAKSGSAEVYIVAPREYEAKISRFLAEYIRVGMIIDLVVIDDMSGSADCLRAVSDRIRGDFICLSSDFISQYCLGELADMHRLNTSDLTMMLTINPSEIKKDEVDEEFIGICDNGRIMLKTPTLEIDEAIAISKPLLHHAPTLSLRRDLVDLGIYIMSHWVIEFLVANRKISSVRTELVPYLIDRQYQSAEYILNHMPALQHRNRPLKAIEHWAVDVAPCKSLNSGEEGLGGEDKNQAILDLMTAMSSNGNSTSSSVCVTSSPMKSNTHTLTSPPSVPSASGTISRSVSVGSNSGCVTDAALAAAMLSRNGGSDLLRCFALVYEPSSNAATGASTGSSTSGSNASIANSAGNVLLNRIMNIPTYLYLNKEIVLHKNTPRTPWARFPTILKKEMSIVGEGGNAASDLLLASSAAGTGTGGGKNIMIKQCCIGNNCNIGAMTKLNNCIVMDNVTIGENCTIQNSIICERAVIESNCKLNDCCIGSEYKVATGSKVKSESFSSASH